MKKLLPLCLALAFGLTLLEAQTPSAPTDFSGNWVLDASQTKNLPDGLESYSLAVTQNAQQLKVQSSLKGDLQPLANPNGPDSGGRGSGRPGRYPGGSPGGYPGGRRGGLGLPGGIGVGWPGGGTGGPMGGGVPGRGTPGGGGRSRGVSKSQAAVAAFTYYPHSADFRLDGGESSAQLGGPTQSDATAKADWAKSGQVLKLSLVENGDAHGQTKLKDEWKLSKDGQSLLVERAIHSPGGSGTLHLVFRKQAPDASKTASQYQAH